MNDLIWGFKALWYVKKNSYRNKTFEIVVLYKKHVS